MSQNTKRKPKSSKNCKNEAMVRIQKANMKRKAEKRKRTSERV